MNSNFFNFFTNFDLKLFNLTLNFKKGVLRSVMPQLRGLFMYDTKQSLNDEVILFLLILPKFFFKKNYNATQILFQAKT
jgi:hypothetical protein